VPNGENDERGSARAAQRRNKKAIPVDRQPQNGDKMVGMEGVERANPSLSKSCPR